MTLPTRPAPAPPVSRAQNAAANANASLEQLRLQLQQQQQLQRNQHTITTPTTNITVPKLTIKLPPPPKQPLSTNVVTNGTGSITRKFPQARYAPATNWDDSPFDILSGVGGNDGGKTNNKPPTSTILNGKKQPPPRPPPPKVLPKKGAAPVQPVQQQSSNILTNIFHLKKKSSRSTTPNNGLSRIYGSATYGTTTNSSSSTTLRSTTTNNYTTSHSLSTDWNSAWYATSTLSTQPTSTSAITTTTEAQLISFDSPPSSPTFTQKSNSDCLSVDSFSSDSNFSSPNNGSVSQPESGFEDDFSATTGRSRPATTSPLDPWEALETFSHTDTSVANTTIQPARYGSIGTAPVRNLSTINTRIQSNGDNPLCNGKSLLPPAPALNMPTIIKPKISQKPKAPKPPPLLATKPHNSILDSSIIYSDNLNTPPSPPMPQCAPPPPPPQTSIFAVANSTDTIASKPTISILDVITGKADATQLSADQESYESAPLEPPHGIALYDFESVEEGDLCFRENEKIYLLEQVSAEWYKGRTRSGCEGIFPINYIEIKVPLNNSISTPNSTQSSSASTTPTYQTAPATNSNSNLKIRCLYYFAAEVEGDLELKENDVVTILYRINEDWLYGEVDGRRGQFPANFLEYVPSNIPMP